jgi:hypothetical protein
VSRFSFLPTNGPACLKNVTDPADTSEWAEVLGAVLVLILVLSLALVASGGWEWFATFLMSSASGWVQAIGSIAAITGAFSIANRQQKAQSIRDFQSARQLRRQRLETCRAVLNRATALFDSSVETLDQPNATKILRIELAHAEGMLASLPLFEIPDSTLVHRFGLLGQSLLHLKIGLDQIDHLNKNSVSRSYVLDAKQWKKECQVSTVYCAGLIRACSTDEELNWHDEEAPTIERIRKFVDGETGGTI